MSQSDRWSRLRIEPQHSRCSAVVRVDSRSALGRQCLRGGEYAGRCYQHHPDADGLSEARRGLEDAVRRLVRLALAAELDLLSLGKARGTIRHALAEVARFEVL